MEEQMPPPEEFLAMVPPEDLDENGMTEADRARVAAYFKQGNGGEQESGGTVESASRQFDSKQGSAAKGKKRKAPSGPGSVNEKGAKNARTGEGSGGSGRVNRSVYLENVPDEIEEEELVEHMGKAGLILMDRATGDYKVKRYVDKGGNLNGTALVTYLRAESVLLALDLLDETRFANRPSSDPLLKVSVADFSHHKDEGSSSTATGPSQAATTNEEEGGQRVAAAAARIKKSRGGMIRQDFLLSWDEGASRKKHLSRAVVLSNVFDPATVEETDGPDWIQELKEDMKSEAEKLGRVELIKVFPDHPDGIVSVRFREAEGAIAGLRAFNGRWFDKRQLRAQLWDGVTRYDKVVNEALSDKRAADFGDWLEAGGGGD